MAKPTVASDWMAGCAGCHMSLLDMDERIIQVADLVNLRAPRLLTSNAQTKAVWMLVSLKVR